MQANNPCQSGKGDLSSAGFSIGAAAQLIAEASDPMEVFIMIMSICDKQRGLPAGSPPHVVPCRRPAPGDEDLQLILAEPLLHL